jgi:hypothetical protein
MPTTGTARRRGVRVRFVVDFDERFEADAVGERQQEASWSSSRMRTMSSRTSAPLAAVS